MPGADRTAVGKRAERARSEAAPAERRRPVAAARDRAALGLAARLVAIGGIFALAVLVQVGGSAALSERQLTALYALVLAGFFATLGWALAARHGSGATLRRLELAIDGALVTGLVYCTGGARSLFSFLYLAWIVHAALRGGSRAAAGAAAGAMLGHALAVLALARSWLPWLDAPDALAPRELYVAIGTHAVAFSLVALLAHRLARQLAHSEGQLQELSELHRRIFESVSSGLLTLDARGCISAFNPEAERISGWASAEVVGRGLAQAFPEVAHACEGMVQLGDGAYARARVGMRNRAGEPLHLGLSRSRLRGAQGAAEGTILIFQDLTRLVEIEDELSRSRRLAAVGQLASGLAHEIRNPLGAMSGAIELLAAELPELGANGRRLARIVQRETERLNRLVVDFLAYARPGALPRERCPLREIADELRELFARSEHHAVRLELDVPADLDAAGDPDALRQVLWNLACNAAEAKPQDGVVRLRAAREPEGRVRIEVSDRGCGMTREVLERVFEPFFSTRPKGTGLGLATVHRLMERQGGSLQLRSAPGQGTTFALLLPELLPDA